MKKILMLLIVVGILCVGCGEMTPYQRQVWSNYFKNMGEYYQNQQSYYQTPQYQLGEISRQLENIWIQNQNQQQGRVIILPSPRPVPSY